MKRKTIDELIAAAKEALRWIWQAKLPNESNATHLRLGKAVKAVEDEMGKSEQGFMLLVESEKGRRITVTVESGENYLSRTGWESLGVNASILYERKIDDIAEAREALKKCARGEKFSGHGMMWSSTPASTLIEIMDRVAGV